MVKKSKKKVIKLKEMLDISRAEDLLSELKKALKSKPESIEIDSSELSRITTPCVQIILAAKKSCSDQGIEFFIGNQSPNFVECIETLGVNLN